LFVVAYYIYTAWPNKKCTTSELSLNHIENTSIRLHFKIKCERKTRTRILSVGIKYSRHDL